MKKISRVKSSNAVTLQVLGVAGVILAIFISFAYLMPENRTSSETITPSVIENSSVSTTISEATVTNTSTKTVATVSSKKVMLSTISTSTVTSTTTTSIAETTTSSYITTEFSKTSSETSVTTSDFEVMETTTADLYSSLYDWSYNYETESSVTEKYYNEAKIVFTEPYSYYSYNDSDDYDDYDTYDDYDAYDDYDNSYDYNSNYDTDTKNSNEKEPEGVYLGRYKITHYCACSICCEEYTGLTASGTIATAGRTASASDDFEFGTKVEIDGNIYVIEDRGAFSESTIDIFCDSHQEAIEKGSYYTDIYIIDED